MATERAYPRFRRDLVVRRVVEAGESAWTVHDPLRNTYYRHDALTHDLCETLDGERGGTAVRAELERTYPQFNFPVEWIDELVGELKRGGFLEDTFKMNEMQRARAKEARRKFAPESLKNIFMIQFGVLDPTRFFRIIYPAMRIVFTRWFVVGSVIAFFVACGMVWDRRDALAGGLATLFTLQNSNWVGLVILWFVLFGIVVAHECGHGLSCMHFGGQPRRLGFMLFYLMPGMFCDVSDIYFFDSRWHRAAVALAGGYVELLCFTAGTFLWVMTPPDLLIHDLAFRVLLFSGMTGLIFNYNPLIKLDGYYTLMSWLDIPDLRERSFTYVGNLFRRHVLRMRVELERLTRYERRAIVIYGSLAFLYSAFYSVMVLLFMRRFLVGHFREAGFVMFTILLFYTTRKMWGSLGRGARYLVLEKGGSARRHSALVAGVGALILGALLVPLPHSVTVQAVLDAADRRTVVAPFDGRVEDVLVGGGASVAPGTVLAIVREDGEGGEALAGRAEARRGEAVLARAISQPWTRLADAGADAATDALSDLPLLRARAAESGARDAHRYVAALGEGRVLALEPRAWVGRHVEAGDSLFVVGRADSLDVLLVASERDAGDVGLGRRADVRLYADPGRQVICSVNSVDRAPLEGPAFAEPTSVLVDSERPARRFVARGRIANPGGELRPGMTGRARIAAPALNLLQRAARFYARIVRADFWL
jgi:putative peptide zinc metalloprotease protein